MLSSLGAEPSAGCRLDSLLPAHATPACPAYGRPAARSGGIRVGRAAADVTTKRTRHESQSSRNPRTHGPAGPMPDNSRITMKMPSESKTSGGFASQGSAVLSSHDCCRFEASERFCLRFGRSCPDDLRSGNLVPAICSGSPVPMTLRNRFLITAAGLCHLLLVPPLVTSQLPPVKSAPQLERCGKNQQPSHNTVCPRGCGAKGKRRRPHNLRHSAGRRRLCLQAARGG